MNFERRQAACAALADYHVDSFAATYNVNPEDLLTDWNLWFTQYEGLDDKELANEIYKMHVAIQFQSKHLDFGHFEADEEIL